MNRITSAANPRFIERVVKGSRFGLEMIYGVYQVDGVNDLDYFAHVVTALRLLEDGTLGGNGSRGYGQIRLKLAEPVFLDGQDYREGSDAWKQASEWPADEAFERGMGDFSLSREDATCQAWDVLLKSSEGEVGKRGAGMKAIYLQSRGAYRNELHSDTLFGLICWAIRQVFSEARLVELLKAFAVGQPPFLLSSAFPCAKDDSGWKPYLPRPLLPPPEPVEDLSREEAQRLKQYKRLRYIPADHFNKFLQGAYSDGLYKPLLFMEF